MFKKIITKTILLLSFVSLFTDIASEMLYPIMPVYLKSIGFSILLIGFLEGLAEATAGLSKGYFGNLSDKIGLRVPFIRWGYALSAFSKPMMAIFTFPLWIFLARTLDRLGKGVRNSARDALLSDETTNEHKGKVFGFHRAMDTVGAAIGPVLALIYLYFYPKNYKMLFLIAFIPGLIAIILTLIIKDKKVKHERKKNKVGFLGYLNYWKIASKQYKILLIGLLLFAFFNSSDAFLLLFIKNQGYSDTTMISIYIYYNLLYALLSFPLGILADKIGLKTIFLIGLCIFSLVYFSYGFAITINHFIILFGLYAIYAASTEGISKAWITNLCDKANTATAIGFYTSFASIFALLSSVFAGFVWFNFGPRSTFIISGIGVFGVFIYLSICNFTIIAKQKKAVN